MSVLALAGSTLLVLIAFPYLVLALRGATRPHPLSWGIWATIGILGTCATGAAHAGAAVYVLATAALVQVLIFLASLRTGFGAVSLNALWPLLPAGVGIGIWCFSGRPVAAAMAVVVADGCALWPTVAKTWAEPMTEPPLLWGLGALAFLLACIAVDTVAFASLLYPIHLVVGNVLVAAIALGRRSRDRALPTVRKAHRC